MCEIATRPITISLPQIPVDYYHCSLFKRGKEEIEVAYTAEIQHPKKAITINVPLPDGPLNGWEFCVIGFHQEHGITEVCKDLTKLETLLIDRCFSFSASQAHEKSAKENQTPFALA